MPHDQPGTHNTLNDPSKINRNIARTTSVHSPHVFTNSDYCVVAWLYNHMIFSYKMT